MPSPSTDSSSDSILWWDPAELPLASGIHRRPRWTFWHLLAVAGAVGVLAPLVCRMAWGY